MKEFVNTVPGVNQLNENEYLQFRIRPGAVKKVLIVGNSITRHAPKADIGWYGDWGMAASEPAKDYVHLVEKGLMEYFGLISLCVAQAAEWESHVHAEKRAILEERYQPAADFETDIIIVRIGENIDINRTSVQELADDFKEMIRFFGSKRPGVQVVLRGLFWWFPEHEKAVHLVAEQEGYRFVALKDLGIDEKMTAKGLFEHGGVAGHPGDLGMEHIAERILEAVEKM